MKLTPQQIKVALSEGPANVICLRKIKIHFLTALLDLSFRNQEHKIHVTQIPILFRQVHLAIVARTVNKIGICDNVSFLMSVLTIHVAM